MPSQSTRLSVLGMKRPMTRTGISAPAELRIEVSNGPSVPEVLPPPRDSLSTPVNAVSNISRNGLPA